MSPSLTAPATRREILALGLLLLAVMMFVLQWNQRTVIVVPASESARSVIT